MYVCMCICICSFNRGTVLWNSNCQYVRTHVCMYVYMHMFFWSGYFPVDSNCQYVHTHVCMYVCMYVCVYAYLSIKILSLGIKKPVCTLVCMYICMFVCMCIHIHVHCIFSLYLFTSFAYMSFPVYISCMHRIMYPPILGE